MSVHTTRRCCIALLLWMVAAGAVFGAALGEEATLLPSFKAPPGSDARRASAVVEALRADQWPQTEARHVAPAISKALLSHSELVTRETISTGSVPFDDTPWGRCEWSWGHVVASKGPPPTALPEERKRALLALLPPERQKDREFVETYLARHLDRYRKSRQYQLRGEMQVTALVAPSSRAAQEYLLATMTESSLPTDLLVKSLVKASRSRPKGLGAVGFVLESRANDDARVWLTRANVFLQVRGRGRFARDVVPLAMTIDLLLMKQSSLTYDELDEERPSITLGPVAEDGRALRFEVSSPSDERIALVEATVNGQPANVSARAISLAGVTGKVKVKATVITEGLLASSAETVITVGE